MQAKYLNNPVTAPCSFKHIYIRDQHCNIRTLDYYVIKILLKSQLLIDDSNKGEVNKEISIIHNYTIIDRF